MGKKIIDVFHGAKYGFLSNFHKCSIIYHGIRYNHSEGAFQAQKTLDEQKRREISMLDPGRAKSTCGRHGSITLRPDWEEVKDNLMYEIVLAKFTQNKDLKEKLLDTGDAELIEGNTWHDNYWGNCTCNKCKNIDGQNNLGKILMRVRKELGECK